jgi:hypothetical protein
LTLLRSNTRGSFDPWDLSGPHFAKIRAKIMSALRGEPVPQAKAGVTVIREAFYNVACPAGECIAERQRNFKEWALRALEGVNAA